MSRGVNMSIYRVYHISRNSMVAFMHMHACVLPRVIFLHFSLCFVFVLLTVFPPPRSGPLLLLHWVRECVRTPHHGGSLQGMPVCGDNHLGHERGGHAGTVGVPGEPAKNIPGT